MNTEFYADNIAPRLIADSIGSTLTPGNYPSTLSTKYKGLQTFFSPDSLMAGFAHISSPNPRHH